MNDLELGPGDPPGLPRPAGVLGIGHLPRWTSDPLRLLEEGAALGPVFSIRLWRPVTVGYTPEWNRAVLGDLDTFHSKGSLSQLSPYLSAGVVSQDNPGHRERRAELNPTFHRRAVTTAFGTDFGDLIQRALPTGEFDAGAWASEVVLAMLARAFFGASFPAGVLESYVAPLDSPMPGPLLRRPFRIRKMNAALESVFAAPEKGSLAELFADLAGGVEEARVVIAAAYDTTAHSLAFALWELAARPDLNEPSMTARIVDETLRLYPSGWIGSRICTTDTVVDGVAVPAGRMVLYSPYLTHRSPDLWPDPQRFRPERFDGPKPAWGYIPFAAGERTCLGAGLATLMLRTAVSAFAGALLERVSGDGRVRGGLTLAPAGPLRLRRAG
ncbi:MAG: cytochrome P450 [Nakamurella sp.]